MANTPIDQGLGRDSQRPSVRTPDWLLDYVENFQADYNTLLTEIADDAAEAERLKLNSQSDALRRLLDIGLGAYYAGHVHMFAAPPGANVCTECGANGEHTRVGIIPLGTDDNDDYIVESRLCLSCGFEEMLYDEDDEDDEEDEAVGFDGLEA